MAPPGRQTRTISAKTHHQKVDYNIFEGMSVTGNAAVTISQGRVVYEKGELKVEKGAGRYIDRPTFPTIFDAVKKVNEIRAPKAVKRAQDKAAE